MRPWAETNAVQPLALLLGCTLLIVSLVTVTRAAEAPLASPLPDPLTLAEALVYADAPNPQLALARAAVDSAKADLLAAASASGIRSYLDLTPQLVNPSTDSSSSLTDDSSVQLLLTKRLYDFGQTKALMHSADSSISAQRHLYINARQQRRLDIMECFFEVLLADAHAAFATESTAYRYVAFDKAHFRQQLGQISDVDMLAYEDLYRQAAVSRAKGQAAQHLTRAHLAVVLNHPDDLPGNLVPPGLPQIDRPVPDYQTFLQNALQANPVILALRDQLQSAKEKVAAAQRLNRPILEAGLEAANWDRELNGRSDARLTLQLHIPIYQNSLNKAAVARARAQLLEAEGRLARVQQGLRTALLALVEKVNDLKLARKAAQVRSAYRDLYVDRSRSMYNLEIKTDLGDAMTKLTEAQWQAAKVDYALALTWAKLDALTGRLITATAKETGQ